VCSIAPNGGSPTATFVGPTSWFHLEPFQPFDQILHSRNESVADLSPPRLREVGRIDHRPPLAVDAVAERDDSGCRRESIRREWLRFLTLGARRDTVHPRAVPSRFRSRASARYSFGSRRRGIGSCAGSWCKARTTYWARLERTASCDDGAYWSWPSAAERRAAGRPRWQWPESLPFSCRISS
jgi:hypothetical protein